MRDFGALYSDLRNLEGAQFAGTGRFIVKKTKDPNGIEVQYIDETTRTIRLKAVQVE